VKKQLLALTIFSLFATTVFAATLEELVGPERAASLRAASESAGRDGILEVQLRNPGFRLLPRHSELGRFMEAAKDGLDPSTLVEGLFLYGKPSGHLRAWDDAERKALFTRTTALGTLAGIQYFSASRGVMRTFYETSHVIDGPRNRNPLPDPSFASLPRNLTLYARQKDLTFGDNTYRFEYLTGTDFIFFSQENLTSMSVGIIPAIGRNNFRMVMAIIDADDSILIYAAAIARAASVPGMGDRVGGSFGNRLSAVMKWFSGHADEVFR